MIYLACLPKFATGGTELLHQFGAALIARGVDVRILYHQAEGDPVPDRFRKYAVPYVADIVDASPDDVIIVPEVLTDLLYEWPQMRKVIWWLSIDFYFRSFYSKRNLRRRFLERKQFYRFGDQGVVHFVQSYYAEQFLRNKGVEVTGHLSDYLGDDFIAQAARPLDGERQPFVLYNPKKGIRLTRRLMKYAKGVDFKAIENMPPAEVARLMRTSAAYVDFGNHPGKDRIPREAAISGAVVIVGRRGSAANGRDVPIEEKFKFVPTTKGLKNAAVLLQRVVKNHDAYDPFFKSYREMIVGERRVFERQVDAFIELM